MSHNLCYFHAGVEVNRTTDGDDCFNSGTETFCPLEAPSAHRSNLSRAPPKKVALDSLVSLNCSLGKHLPPLLIIRLSLLRETGKSGGLFHLVPTLV